MKIWFAFVYRPEREKALLKMKVDRILTSFVDSGRINIIGVIKLMRLK